MGIRRARRRHRGGPPAAAHTYLAVQGPVGVEDLEAIVVGVGGVAGLGGRELAEDLLGHEFVQAGLPDGGVRRGL